jgi:hypothetical protein
MIRNTYLNDKEHHSGLHCHLTSENYAHIGYDVTE